MNVLSLGNGFYRLVNVTPSQTEKRPDALHSVLFTKQADGEVMIIRGNFIVSRAEVQKASQWVQ